MRGFIFLFFFLVQFQLVYCQVSNFDQLDKGLRKTILLDNHFKLFYSLKGYYIEKVFFLEDGIVLWDKFNSKFVLLGYDSKIIEDELSLSKKIGFKKSASNLYNPFFYNSLVDPVIVGDNLINFGIVKTNKKLGYKGYQILNLKIEEDVLQFILEPYIPENIFSQIQLNDPKNLEIKYKFQEGLAVIQFRNQYKLEEDNVDLYQFFGKPFIKSKKRSKSSYNRIFNPSIFIKKSGESGKYILEDKGFVYSNLNHFQLAPIENDLILFRSVDDIFYSIKDKVQYELKFNSPVDSFEQYHSSEILIDRFSNEKFILKTYKILKDSSYYKYKFYKFDSIALTSNEISLSLDFLVDSRDEVDFLAIHDNWLFVRKFNKEIPDEIGIYYIEIAYEKGALSVIDMKKGTLFNDVINEYPKKIKPGFRISQDYRLLNKKEASIFPDNSNDTLINKICQETINCLLKSIYELLETGNYKYVYSNLVAYDDDDLEFLENNQDLFGKIDSFKSMNSVIKEAYKNFDESIWSETKEGFYEGVYKDRFILFVIKIEDKYFLSIQMLK